MAGTGVAYPADAVAGSPQFTANQGRNAFSAFMAGATAARPLGGVTGVRPGTPSTTITATSTTWTMNPNGFAGYIDLESSVTNSGYAFAFSGTITGAVTAAGGSARTDLVYVQINDSNTSDGSTGAPRVVIDYISNYPTTALPARAFAIAQINVPASGGGSPTVTWVAPYTVAAGGILPTASSAFYPASSYAGQYLDDVNLGLMRSNGTSWLPLPAGRILPTSAVGGTVSPNGEVVFSGATSLSVNGCFSSQFRRYEISFDISLVSGTASNLLFRLRAAGTDLATSTYSYGGTTNGNPSGNTSAASTTTGFYLTRNASGTTNTSGAFNLFNPGLAVAKRGSAHFAVGNASYFSSDIVGGGQGSTSTYDGFTIVGDGGAAMTGTVWITGR